MRPPQAANDVRTGPGRNAFQEIPEVIRIRSVLPTEEFSPVFEQEGGVEFHLGEDCSSLHGRVEFARMLVGSNP